MLPAKQSTLINWIMNPTLLPPYYIFSKPHHCVPPPPDCEFQYMSACMKRCGTPFAAVRTVKFTLKHGSDSVEMEVTNDAVTYASPAHVPRGLISSPKGVCLMMDDLFE
jgi:hypothetical protein